MKLVLALLAFCGAINPPRCVQSLTAFFTNSAPYTHLKRGGVPRKLIPGVIDKQYVADIREAFHDVVNRQTKYTIEGDIFKGTARKVKVGTVQNNPISRAADFLKEEPAQDIDHKFTSDELKKVHFLQGLSPRLEVYEVAEGIMQARLTPKEEVKTVIPQSGYNQPSDLVSDGKDGSDISGPRRWDPESRSFVSDEM